MTWHGCCIIKETAHSGIVTWVTTPDAMNILRERTIAVITIYRDMEGTIPGACLLADLQQHLCLKANRINLHLVQTGATNVSLMALQHPQRGSDTAPKVLWALLCAVLQPVYDCKSTGEFQFGRILNPLSAGVNNWPWPYINTILSLAKPRAHLNCCNVQHCHKKVCQI